MAKAFGWLKKLSWKKRFLYGGVFVVLLLILFSRKGPTKVTTSQVTKGDLVETVSASGEIDAEEKADLTFQGGGRLAWVGVKEGEAVKKGQGIASLDLTLANAAYQEAINTYTSLNAAAQKAEDDVKGHSADESYAQKATRVAAQTARDSAYDAMRAAQKTLQFGTISAPFAGVMTQVNPASPGSNVLPSTAVYSVVNPDTYYFSTEVGETDIAQIKLNQNVDLKLDAFPGEDFKGVVTNIGFASVLTSTGGTAYKVKITLSKSDSLIYRLGMNGDAEIVTNTVKDVLSVSSDAIVEQDDGNYVWKVENGKAVKVKVETGASSVEATEIKKGLNVGDVVIVQPPTNLKAGSKVKV